MFFRFVLFSFYFLAIVIVWNIIVLFLRTCRQKKQRIKCIGSAQTYLKSSTRSRASWVRFAVCWYARITLTDLNAKKMLWLSLSTTVVHLCALLIVWRRKSWDLDHYPVRKATFLVACPRVGYTIIWFWSYTTLGTMTLLMSRLSEELHLKT